MKIQKRFCVLICCCTFCIMHYALPCFAQGDDKPVLLSKKIIEAKSNEELYGFFEELSNIYFEGNKYAEFIDFLKSLSEKKKNIEPFINYYVGLTRYRQLKYLEEKQIWDEYFSQGNTYRDEITASMQKVIDTAQASEPLRIYARLILWQFHKDQQDVFTDQALTDLMDSAFEYAKTARDTKPLKLAADRLLAYGEKGKSKELYRIYADKTIGSEIKDDELKEIALGSYKEGNLDLAETFYDVYVGRITKNLTPQKTVPLLTDIARQFAYKDRQPNDPLYAEKIFEKIEGLSGEKGFDQDLIYLRAFNLEKAKEYAKAKDWYLKLTDSNAAFFDKITYKIGIIYTYISGDIKQGKEYFGKLAQKETLSPAGQASLYQLGLLAQWQNDLDKAKEYYNKLIEKAGSIKGLLPETATLANERLKEIEEGEPLEYGLRTFLDAALKERNLNLQEKGIGLNCHPYDAKKNEEINIASTSYTSSSGCLQVEIQYLWSGQLGKIKPSADAPSFTTSYSEAGTKEINLVIISPSGIVGANFDLLDIE